VPNDVLFLFGGIADVASVVDVLDCK